MITPDVSTMFCLFIGLAIGLVCGFGIGYFSAWLEDKVSDWAEDDGSLSREDLELERYREEYLKRSGVMEPRIYDPSWIINGYD